MADTDEDQNESEVTLLTRDRLLLAAVLVVGIAGTGILRRQLGVMGFNALGRLVFILGYGGTVLLVWYGWIRPLDISGPQSNATPHAEDGDDVSGATERQARKEE